MTDKNTGITTAVARRSLTPRREPYWSRVSAGQFLGFRKLDEGNGTWIARWRTEEGGQRYQALGTFAELDDARRFDEARKAAVLWFTQCEGGRPDLITVEKACELYVADRRKVKGDKTAADAEGRFNRHVTGTKFGQIELSKLRTSDVKAWLERLIETDPETDDDEDPDADRRAKDSANRDLATLKAALNFGYRQGYCTLTAAWDRVQSFHGVAQRRLSFLTIAERKALLLAATPEFQRLIKVLLLTACRPGEIAAAKVGDFDPVNGLLTVSGKTGRRTVPVSPDALAHLKSCTVDRAADAPMIARDNGTAWNRFDWRDAMQEARAAAGLPDEVVIYTLRHVAISELCAAGLDPMTVARIAGTSVQMISSNYGHLMRDRIADKLAAAKIL